MYVLATPLEVAVRFVDPELFAAETRKPSFPSSEKALADLRNLRTAPMAAFHLTLKRKVDLPKEHVLLYNSRFLTSFIDLAEHWSLPTSEIAIIASNFIPLESLVDDDPSAPYVRGIDSPAAQAVIDDLLEFVPEITRGDIDEDRSFSIFNVRHQLFLNTVGAWPFRPSTNTRLENLFVAGDYCQTEADITTMESAVISGLSTAAAILEKAGNPSTVHIESLKTDAGWNPFRSYPRIPLRMVEYAAMPLMAALFGTWVLWKALWPSDEA